MTSSAVNDVLTAQDFYPRTAQFMRVLDPLWEEQRVQDGIDADRARLLAVLGRGEGGTALDCSCGPGTQVIPLVDLGWRVTGLDAIAAVIADGRARAQRMGINAEWRIGDMTSVDALFEPGSFDLVISCMALDNLLSDDDLQRAVQAMHDVLKPSGRCYLRLRDIEHLVDVRSRYDVRDQRQIEHGRVLRLEDWLYVDTTLVVNVWIFLREDTAKRGYRWERPCLRTAAAC